MFSSFATVEACVYIVTSPCSTREFVLVLGINRDLFKIMLNRIGISGCYKIQ